MNLNLTSATVTWKRIAIRHMALAGGLAIALSVASGNVVVPNTDSTTPQATAAEYPIRQQQAVQPTIVYQLVSSQAEADVVNTAQTAVLQGVPLPRSVAIPVVVKSEEEARAVLQAGMHAAIDGLAAPAFVIVDARR